MMNRIRHILSAIILGVAFSPSAMAQNGIVFTGQGAINRSMAGASTAAPLDSLGAIYWNPATISALPSSEVGFGLELLAPQSSVSSSIPADAFAPGFPGVDLSGTTDSDAGVFALPSFAIVSQDPDSFWAWGLGVMAIGGVGVDYPTNNNPILQAPPPTGLGVGPLYSNLQIMQVLPTLSVDLDDRWSLGISPTVTLASLSLDPNIVSQGEFPGGGSFVSYPRSGNSPITAGGGIHLGVYYQGESGWQWGSSIKSPQWLDDLDFNAISSTGAPQQANFKLDYPMIASMGVAYSGYEQWLFATDIRYTDYAHTDGFRQSGFDPITGTVRGLGWRSTFAVASGIQRQISEQLSVRGGYSFNQSPQQSEPAGSTSANATINAAAPAIIEHTLYAGLSWKMRDAITFSCAYAHGFENSVGGVYRGPIVVVPGSNVTNTASADSFIFGINVAFGNRRCHTPAQSCCEPGA